MEKCVQHVTGKVEPKMWELDNLIEVQIEPLVINTTLRIVVVRAHPNKICIKYKFLFYTNHFLQI